MSFRNTISLCLAVACASPVWAETYVNPDQGWWNTFLEAVDGTEPDFEAMARRDPQYLSADEFDRAAVLRDVIARMQEQQADFEVASAEVKITFGAKLGDYSAQNGGFPVNLFSQNMHLPVGFNKIFFRNWQDYNIYPATADEGRELRDRIGQQQVVAQVTLTNIQASTTRPNAYDAFVSKVAYFAQDGLSLAEFTATEEAPLSDDVAADMVATARATIIDAAGIPDLGTPWDEAKVMLEEAYAYVASDDFAYTDTGKRVAFRMDEGAVVTDEAHAVDQSFRVFLQQVDGPWRTTSGFRGSDVLAGMNSGYSVDTKGAGPGLACYTPDIIDRCAVLEFAPSDAGHVLTRAYGVIEVDPGSPLEEIAETFLGDAAEVFDGFTANLGYDPAAVRHGATQNYEDRGGVPAYAAGAGETIEGEPFYDPLADTRAINAINREVAVFAVGGAENRIPLIFVLQ